VDQIFKITQNHEISYYVKTVVQMISLGRIGIWLRVEKFVPTKILRQR